MPDQIPQSPAFPDSSIPPQPPPTDRSVGDRIGILIAWFFIAATVGLIFVSNAVGPKSGHASRPTTQPSPAQLSSDEPVPPPNLELKMQSRLSIGIHELNKLIETQQPTPTLQNQARQNDKDAADRIRADAVTPEDHVTAAPVVAVLLGKHEGLKELEHLAVPAGPAGAAIDRDITDMRTLLSSDASAGGLDDAERARVKKRFGWNGELALTWQLPPSDPARKAVANKALLTVVTLVGIGGIVICAAVIGLVLAILAIGKYRKGRIRSTYMFGSGPPPLPPLPMPPLAPWAAGSGIPYMPARPQAAGPRVRGGPFVEAFAIYLAGQIPFGLLVHWLIPDASLAVEFLLAPLILVAAFWPRWRGISAGEWRRAIGWHLGQGLFKEIWAGIVGYITGLPVFITGVLVMLVVVTLTHTSSPTHPIQFEIGGGFWSVLGIYLLACVWAPIVEETMFRGLLFHHLRRFGQGWRWIFAAPLVSFIFAAIHPQGWAAIPALGALAMVLAGIREWRGSAIGSMTGHFLQNFTAVTVMLLVMT